MSVHLDTDGGAPTQNHVEQVRAILSQMPRFAELGRAYLSNHEECEWLEGGAAHFEPEIIKSIDDARNFWLTFGHPADPDGMYGVEYIDGAPVSSSRSD